MRRMDAGMIVVLAASLAPPPGVAAPLGTGFTYQGRLTSTATPTPASADFIFTLHDMLSGGMQVAGPLTITGVGVVNGLFTVEIDFGNTIFDSQARWLGIQVRAPAGSGSFTPLTPRQPLTATPYALQTRGLFVDNASQLGLGTTAPQSLLHLFGASPILRIQDNDDPLSYALLQDLQPTLFRISKVTSSGGSLLDLNPSPADGVGTATVRIFRETNTTGTTRVLFHRGDGTATVDAQIGVRGTASYFNGGDVGIGTTTPSARLSVVGGSLLVSRAGPDPVATFENTANILTGTTTSIGQVVVKSRAQQGLSAPVESRLILEAESTTGGGQNAVRIRAENRPLEVLAGGSVEIQGSDLFDVDLGGAGFTLGGDANSIAGTRTNTISLGVGSTIGGGGVTTICFDSPGCVPTNPHSISDSFCTIAGGAKNRAGNDDADPVNARSATVSGGFNNTASGRESVVGGGRSNTASGLFATVPGGFSSQATGTGSFAAGCQARANHNGSFVWADAFPTDTGPTFASSADNQFNIRANGGVRIASQTNGTTGAITAGVQLLPGASSWSNLSDRNSKRNFKDLDKRELLEHLEKVPIQTWSYKAQSDSIRHIGPMAQDFHAAFGVGEDERLINSLDADGVALAGVQALHELVKEKEAVIDHQRKQIDELTSRLERIEASVASLVERREGGDR